MVCHAHRTMTDSPNSLGEVVILSSAHLKMRTLTTARLSNLFKVSASLKDGREGLGGTPAAGHQPVTAMTPAGRKLPCGTVLVTLTVLPASGFQFHFLVVELSQDLSN